ncbi:MAG TPA: AI-2E family transporter [Bryobacteraceae bacterium]|jgi:predicted PurR-regulated permease PerM|nr:AI-2E family transporter [Bryobacteraceae bacterium]
MALVSRQLEQMARTRTFPLIGVGVLIALLYWARVFFITFFTAVAIAFILEPFVALLMRIRFPRSLASFVVCSVGLLAVYLMGLGAYTQVASLIEDYQQNYGQKVADAVQNVRTSIEEMEKATYQLVVPAKQQQKQHEEQTRQRRKKTPEPPPAPAPETKPVDRFPVTEFLYTRLGSVYQVLLMSSFVPFLVYFMLSWRDHAHRSFLQFFEGDDRTVAAKSLERIAEIVRSFVVGNFALGLLLAVASSLIFWKMGLPYPLLTGPLSGFFSLVPYIGLPLALAPPMLVSLMVFQGVSSFVLLGAIVMLLHIVALNLLYPKFVGSRVHLNPLVVTVALMFWGFLWDAAGLILAIPLTAGIKAVCDNVTSMRQYGKFLGD